MRPAAADPSSVGGLRPAISPEGTGPASGPARHRVLRGAKREAWI
jgi:hypothetical protein